MSEVNLSKQLRSCFICMAFAEIAAAVGISQASCDINEYIGELLVLQAVYTVLPDCNHLCKIDVSWIL